MIQALMNVKEVQTALGLGKSSTWAEIASGRLPTVRVGPGGRRRMVHPDDLKRYIEERREGECDSSPHAPAPKGGR